ncbi:lytic transglycosylase domain-containing protein [Acetobacter sp. AN02]|uniref:lytic transglycosylase domain-containing protein n=1 Tax=Acetobacter sp. AN02 TaxID=2894186 RepID=UPI00325FA4AE
MPPVILACMLASAAQYHLPSKALPAISQVEGGRPGLVSRNTDGSADLGLMQINTRWVLPLAAATHVSVPETAERLIHDPCFSIRAAAIVLSTYIREEHGDVLRAVGDYHSHTDTLNEEYRMKVVAAALGLSGTGSAASGQVRFRRAGGHLIPVVWPVRRHGKAAR